MDREHLNGSGLGVVLPHAQPVALLGEVEPVEEGREARGRVARREVDEVLDEGVEARPSGGGRVVRRDLDVEQQLLLDDGHEVGQRKAHPSAQTRDESAEVAQPCDALVGECGELRMLRRSRRARLESGDEVEGVDERRVLVDGDGSPDPLGRRRR